MPVYCVTRKQNFQEASEEIRRCHKIDVGEVLYTVKDVESIRLKACFKCGARYCMVIHQYRLRYSQNLFGSVAYIIVVRFKCTCCGATATVIPYFVHCGHVYDARAIYSCLYHLITTGHALGKRDGVPVCPSWWLQQRWYKDFRYQIGFGTPSRTEMLAFLRSTRIQALILQRNYVRMEEYPPCERNPSLHHGLRVAMPFAPR